ncbi:hypothetical protein NECAME_16894 [Necator americanus]|uniref:G-protein coupled receptors family 1 profile domain-containing protein n=1 Tax=Necator americanus TaxID=51031 RepID=W2TTL8_NECAM|nr:hypothetical protein NECAME_16894 [Necator americanus]ETN85133.1 hypothetical protein NECAME_16894 [Necator americanus]
MFPGTQPWKMCFVGCFGLITALVSVFHNCLLFYTFNRSKVLRKRNLTYLMWISGCDIFVSISYIAIMCVQVYIDFFESLTLFYLWHRCLRAAFTVSHITFSSSSFLLMAATIERYLQSTQDGRYRTRIREIFDQTGPVRAFTSFRAEHLFRILVRNRGSVVLLCFAASCIFRGTVFFEVAVLHNPHCTGFSSMGLAVARIFTNPVHDAIWRFWIRKIVTVFLPFAVLAWFNAAIVFSVQKTDRDQTVKALVLFTTVGSRAEITRLRSRLRAVTRMLVMVVCCYLASNIIDVVIAFWETIDITSLCAYRGFYTVTTDISSFLPILACALRLPIYAANDKQIRTEVWKNTLNHYNIHLFISTF